ncbi:mannitol-1-phosphate/altronate dehydrogenase [Rheinheimera pacifica]|uniref:mannitol dehydrogenase family protein n=1 Tax=Rheinheimera pacifica TaxID=173990 RepID=UPI00386210B4|nr:mannitol-1-phosphate/altronate dehydrogenase [Rheinheimera pacifica]
MTDVDPIKQASPQLLHGEYAALAYAGTLAGYSYTHQVQADPLFTRYLQHLLHYEMTTAPGPQNTAAVLQQPAAAQDKKSLQQLTQNGSQQLIPAILATAEQRLANGLAIDALCFTVAAWLRFSMGFDAKGDMLQVVDPLAERLMQIRLQYWDHIDELVAQYLLVTPLFSVTLRDNTLFRDRLTYWLSYILANGVVTALQTLILEVQDYSAAPRLAGGKV